MAGTVVVTAGNWHYDATAGLGEPASGRYRLDVPPAPGPATALGFTLADWDGVDRSAELLELRMGDIVTVQEVNFADRLQAFELVGDPIDRLTWIELPVSQSATPSQNPGTAEDLYQLLYHDTGTAATGAYATVDQLAKALHTRVTTENEAALEQALAAAATEINFDLDRAGSPLPAPVPAAISLANIALAVEAWKLPDAAFGVLGFDASGVVRAAKDNLPRYWSLLTPYKLGWAIA